VVQAQRRTRARHTHQEGGDGEELVVVRRVLLDGLLDGAVEEVQLAGLQVALHGGEVLPLQVARAALLRVLPQDVPWRYGDRGKMMDEWIRKGFLFVCWFGGKGF
jgi:hypothetical protein